MQNSVKNDVQEKMETLKSEFHSLKREKEENDQVLKKIKEELTAAKVQH